MMRRTAFLVVALIGMSSVAYGEIEKLAIPSETGVCLHWWPRLPALPGWHHDREHSLHYDANVLAPDGFTFKNAETVIYARALYKPRIPETTSLESLIESDKREFLEQSPTIEIAEADDLTTADGRRFRSFKFFPKAEGNWERVAYGEEGDFFLIFTVSSRSMQGFRAGESAFEDLVRKYREARPAPATSDE